MPYYSKILVILVTVIVGGSSRGNGVKSSGNDGVTTVEPPPPPTNPIHLSPLANRAATAPQPQIPPSTTHRATTTFAINLTSPSLTPLPPFPLSAASSLPWPYQHQLRRARAAGNIASSSSPTATIINCSNDDARSSYNGGEYCLWYRFAARSPPLVLRVVADPPLSPSLTQLLSL